MEESKYVSFSHDFNEMVEKKLSSKNVVRTSTAGRIEESGIIGQSNNARKSSGQNNFETQFNI